MLCAYTEVPTGRGGGALPGSTVPCRFTFSYGKQIGPNLPSQTWRIVSQSNEFLFSLSLFTHIAVLNKEGRRDPKAMPEGACGAAEGSVCRQGCFS